MKKYFALIVTVSSIAFTNTELLDAIKKRDQQHSEYRAFGLKSGGLLAFATLQTIGRDKSALIWAGLAPVL